MSRHVRLTSRGRRRLSRARRSGEPLALPESPQHREWRHKHELAAERIEEHRASVRGVLAEASALLEDDQADSLAWQELSKRLQDRAELLSSAIYCLREWPEPDDARRDEFPSATFGDRRRALADRRAVT